MIARITIVLLLLSSIVVAQDIKPNTPLVNKQELHTSGTRDFENNSVTNFGYQRFFQEYQINDNWVFRSEFIQTQTATYNVIELPLLVRHRVTERFSILFGPKVDIITRGGEVNSSGFGASFTIGVEYDITENLYIFLRYDYKLMGSYPAMHPKSGSKSSLNFGAGFKF